MTRKSKNSTPAPAPAPPVLTPLQPPASALMEHVKELRKLSDLVLMPVTQTDIQRLLAEHGAADRLSAHGLRVSNRLLFRGAPGNGKTAAAEAIAYALGRHLLVVRGETIISDYVGVSSKNVRRMFEEANAGPYVVLVDECDSILISRCGLHGDGVGIEARRMTNSFLIGMEDARKSPSIFICATNMDGDLDPAALRRFDQVVDFPLPGGLERRKLFVMLAERHGIILGQRALQEPLLRQLCGSFADVERLVIDAAKDTIITGIDFWDAIRAELCRRGAAPGKDDTK